MLASVLVAPAVQMEGGPAYLTDSHGASGVVHAFLELTRSAAEYDPYWKGALDWLVSVAEHDDEGRAYWVMSTSAPEGHPSHQINVAGMCHTIRMLFAGHERCGDKRYRDTALSAVRSLTERFAVKKETHLGTGYAWSHSYRPRNRSLGMLAGHSHGLGNLIDVVLDAHRAEPTDRTRAALEGLLINLRLRAKIVERDATSPVIAWPALKNPHVVETGYCYGQAGVVLPLLSLAEELPDLKLSDGTTALDLANANLRYLMRVAHAQGDGFVWPHMRHEKRSRNIGLGSGTGGIGWAFLRGAEANRKIDPAFAEECMRYARGAAVYAVELVESAKDVERLTSPGGAEGFGVCGGSGGAGHFLMLYAEAAGDDNEDFTARVQSAIDRIARLVMAAAMDIDGTLAIPDHGHFKRINLALDYGQTGVLLGLAGAARYLEDQEILDAAKRVADYIVARAEPAGSGYRFAQFHPIPETAGGN